MHQQVEENKGADVSHPAVLEQVPELRNVDYLLVRDVEGHLDVDERLRDWAVFNLANVVVDKCLVPRLVISLEE